MWGLGICLPDTDKDRGADHAAVSSIAKRALLVDVRDELTADHYQLDTRTSVPVPHLSTFPPGLENLTAKQSLWQHMMVYKTSKYMTLL